MKSMMSMKWAMVCSVEDSSVLPQLEEFGIQLCKSLGEKAATLGLTHEFETNPEIVLHTEPTDFDAFVAAYKKVTDENPGIMVIFQILPSHKSCVYGWMKQLPYEIGRIRQGISVENALTMFDGLNLQEVLVKIIHWISLCIGRVVNNDDCICNLRVGPSKEPTIPSGQVIRMSGVENVVQSVLHGSETVDNEWALSTVKVVGYPNNYNQYQLAAIFYNFHIVHIHFEGDSAVVSFINKFHAAQAVMTFDGFKLDSNHVLSVTPLSDIVKEQVNLV